MVLLIEPIADYKVKSGPPSPQEPPIGKAALEIVIRCHLCDFPEGVTILWRGRRKNSDRINSILQEQVDSHIVSYKKLHVKLPVRPPGWPMRGWTAPARGGCIETPHSGPGGAPCPPIPPSLPASTPPAPSTAGWSPEPCLQQTRV